ncbi:MAG: penicillin-binding protein activator LpoB [Candidatus Latescibacterota bacterium]
MKSVLCFLVAIAFIMSNCASRQVVRVDEKAQIDLSGRWNDTDSKLVAEEMIRDSLSRIWLTDFIEAKGKKPTVVVGVVRNKTHELISTETFIKDMEREFVNSGKVKAAQAGEAREELRRERASQQEFASPETVKKWGREKGADFILQGVINSIVDTISNKKVVFYQIDLELTDIESNEKVWIGSKKIKKFIKN